MNSMNGPNARSVLVWGGGAIGATVAAFMARAGVNTTLIDVDRDHINAINRDGLAVAGRCGQFVVRLGASHPSEITGLHDIVFLAVKAHETDSAMDGVARHLASDGTVVSLQNGLCELTIMQRVGARRTVGATINFGAYRTQAGEVLVGNQGTIVIGELDGKMTRRVEDVADLLRCFEPRTKVTDNIWGYLWGKLAYSTLIKASALDNEPMSSFFLDPRRRPIHIGLIREVLRVARAQRVATMGFDGFDPKTFEEGTPAEISECIGQMALFFGASAKPQSTVWQDLAVLKRKTDAPAQLAPLLDLAAQQGIELPLNRKLVDLIQSIEEGSVIQGPHLLDGLTALASDRNQP